MIEDAGFTSQAQRTPSPLLALADDTHSHLRKGAYELGLNRQVTLDRLYESTYDDRLMHKRMGICYGVLHTCHAVDN